MSERGPAGRDGRDGRDGDNGFDGNAGAQGPRGFLGLKGDIGPRGDLGPQGPQGEQGPQGDTGQAGTIGPQGPTGQSGSNGSRGPQGSLGQQGIPGEPGQIPLHRWEGTALQFELPDGAWGALIDLKGAQGARGRDGGGASHDGGAGSGGSGSQGPQGATGATGSQGSVGSQGVAGSQGATGSQGAQGAPASTAFQLEFLIGDGTNVITTGLKATAVIVAPRAGTITGWTILSCDAASPTSGSIAFDIWKKAYANYPPLVSDSIITGSPTEKPVVSSAIKNQSTVVNNWTTGFLLGDIFFINVDSITSFKAVKLILSYS